MARLRIGELAAPILEDLESGGTERDCAALSADRFALSYSQNVLQKTDLAPLEISVDGKQLQSPLRGADASGIKLRVADYPQ